MVIVHLYLAACLLGALYFFYVGLKEDLFKGPDFKFGYNFYNPREHKLVNPFAGGSMMWMLTFLACCPIVNLLTLGFIVYSWGDRRAKT